MDDFIKEILSIPYKISHNKNRKKEEQLNSCKELARKALVVQTDINLALSDDNTYLPLNQLDIWKAKYLEIYNQIKTINKSGINKQILTSFSEEFQSFLTMYENIEGLRDIHNRDFIQCQSRVLKDLFSSVEGHALDSQQIECILKDDKNNLVIAGAGSGKTTTILGKVKYLLYTNRCTPDEMLILSFTKASSEEMAQRLKKETSQQFNVMTFHKLGLSIIAEVEGKKPTVSNIDMYDFIRHRFAQLLAKKEFFMKFLVFFISFMKEYKSQFDCKSESEFNSYISDNSIVTIKNEKVKSFEEMMIANFLFMNSINYIYEEKYEIDTADREHGQYKPDFYLPDYKIYIEHFAIDENGNVPSFFKGNNEKTGKELYNESIKWKRQIHKQNKTKFIETFSYEAYEGNLTVNLQKKLEKEGVVLTPVDANMFLKELKNNDSTELSGLIELIMTFTNLIKANDYSFIDLNERNKKLSSGLSYLRNEAFLSIIEPIYSGYNEALEQNNEIDFSDMINKATEYVKEGLYLKKYKYIIIDEYQDISNARYKLIKAIKDRNESSLFCVGDDWQSIYRFSGSDVNFFIDFEKYWGPTERSLIETTYRFPNSLIEVSSDFILRNPFQIKKSLKSKITDIIISYGFINCSSEHFFAEELKNKLKELPAKSKVFLLGRYTLDVKKVVDKDISVKHDFHRDKRTIVYDCRKDLEIEFLTVHKSKGLQADYVFIINNNKQRLGFPSNIQDDSILKLVLENKEEFPYSEERRLFYVALTRAKKYVWLMTINDNKSVFIAEVERKYKVENKKECSKCPQCGDGKLIYRKGKFGPFWGCSNYPSCKYTKKVGLKI